MCLRFKLMHVLAHPSIQNAVNSEYTVGTVDLSSINNASMPNPLFLIFVANAWGIPLPFGPIWILTYQTLAITCNFLPAARRAIREQSFEQVISSFCALRCVQQS